MLVAYDASTPARRALEHAADLARPGDRVAVVSVMPEPGVGARIAPSSEARNRQWQPLEEARQLLASRGIEAESLAPVGDAATEILAAADQRGAHVIVVGRHRGRTAHFHGSISGRVVRGATCDVLVVHAGDAESGSAS
jgi:nucleotide-binding universal stress UspA family protein